jgi:hypothetical protein
VNTLCPYVWNKWSWAHMQWVLGFVHKIKYDTPIAPRWGWLSTDHGPTPPGLPVSVVVHTRLPWLQQSDPRLPLPTLLGPWLELLWRPGGDTRKWGRWSHWDDGARGTHRLLRAMPRWHCRHTEHAFIDPLSGGAWVAIAPWGCLWPREPRV